MNYKPGNFYWVTPEEFRNIPNGIRLICMGNGDNPKITLKVTHSLLFPKRKDDYITVSLWILILDDEPIHPKTEIVKWEKLAVRKANQIPDNNRTCFISRKDCNNSITGFYDSDLKSWKAFPLGNCVEISEWVEGFFDNCS